MARKIYEIAFDGMVIAAGGIISNREWLANPIARDDEHVKTCTEQMFYWRRSLRTWARMMPRPIIGA